VRFTWIASGKSHSHLKHRTSLLRDHSGAAAGSHHPGKFSEEFGHLGITLGKKRPQGELATRMPKIFCHETFAAFRTAPEWSPLCRHCGWNPSGDAESVSKTKSMLSQHSKIHFELVAQELLDSLTL
jgi:hypothetical protein